MWILSTITHTVLSWFDPRARSCARQHSTIGMVILLSGSLDRFEEVVAFKAAFSRLWSRMHSTIAGRGSPLSGEEVTYTIICGEDTLGVGLPLFAPIISSKAFLSRCLAD